MPTVFQLLPRNWPVYAVAHLAAGRWLVRAPDDDPFTPPVRVVAVFDESEIGRADSRLPPRYRHAPAGAAPGRA